MSRRTDLLQQLLASNKFGKEKEQEQQFLMATAELILSDLIDIAINGFAKQGWIFSNQFTKRFIYLYERTLD